MGYKSNINWLFSIQNLGIKLGLVRINRFLSRLGHPERKFPSVLVAGTNGKGSTCALINSILNEAGYKTGLYTSPHILSFSERIRLFKYDYIPISYVNDFINNNKSFIESNGITFFEATTAMAFDYFAHSNVDIAVVEVGMGGRFDATNILHPIISIITSISFDHTEYLGNTLEKIYYNKYGISRNYNKLLVSETISSDILNSQKNKREIKRCSDLDLFPVKMQLDKMIISYNGENIKSKLIGKHQIDNLKIAITAAFELKNLGYKIEESCIKKGIENVFWPARFQLLTREPIIIVDVAHNPDGARAIRETIDITEETKNGLTIICGIMADKDVRSFLRELIRINDTFISIQPKCDRALSYEELLKLARQTGYRDSYGFKYIKDAFETALRIGKPILAVGSHYTAAELIIELRDRFGIKVDGMIYDWC